MPRRIRSQHFYCSISSVSVRYDGSTPTRALLNGSGTAKVVAIKKKKSTRAIEPSDSIGCESVVCDISNERPAATSDPKMRAGTACRVEERGRASV